MVKTEPPEEKKRRRVVAVGGFQSDAETSACHPPQAVHAVMHPPPHSPHLSLHSHSNKMGSKYAQRVWVQTMPRQPLDTFLPITPQLAAEVEDAVAFIQAHGLQHTILRLLCRDDTAHWAW